MGVAALLLPHRVLSLFGVAVHTADGRNEVRAVYGGFGIAVAALLIAALCTPELRTGVMVAIATAAAGMAGGRLVSALTDRSAGFYPLLFFTTEIAIAATLLAAARISG
jgi:hypothetical protein